MGMDSFAKSHSKDGVEAKEEQITDECKQLLSSLPKEIGWRTSHLYQYQGFWCQPAEIQSIVAFQKHFQSSENDIILATMPKSGTTWLKALAFTVVNRDRFPLSNKHPLLSSNPHDLVPFFEYKLYANNQIPDLTKYNAGRPRVFGTHIPFPSLANSIKRSNCRVVYLCRNPLDTFISSWHFIGSMSPFTLEEAFDMCCNGVIGFGPFWDHMLGYWKQSRENAENLFFLTYECLKEDTVFHLKRLAKFLGCPFSMEEETSGVVEKIVELCSFQNLKDLEVNKNGKSIKNFENKTLFRKGEVGDWVNYLSPITAEKMSIIMKEKLGGSGLEFKLLP